MVVHIKTLRGTNYSLSLPCLRVMQAKTFYKVLNNAKVMQKFYEKIKWDTI